MNQLREIDAQSKELGPLLCSGKVRVTDAINAGAELEEVDSDLTTTRKCTDARARLALHRR